MAASVSVLLGAAGCSGGSTAPTTGAAALKIGLVLSLTGSGSAPAGPIVQGAMVAIAEINAGLAAGSPHFQLVQADDGGDAKKAGQVCTRLAASDSVVAIVGAESPTATAACAQSALTSRIPYFGSTGTDGGVCLANTFFVGMAPNQAATPLVDLLHKSQGARSFYLVGTSAPKDRTDAVARAVASDGGIVLGTSYVQPNSDFSSELAKIAGTHPDVVIDTLVGGDQIAFHQKLGNDLRTTGLKKASLQMDETAARTIGAAAVGAFVADDYLPSDPAPGNKAWLAAILSKYGDGAIPTAAGAAMYDAIEFLAAAIKTAGRTDGASIISAASRVSTDGPRGPVRIGPFSHGYATLAAHLGQVNSHYGIDQIAISPPIAPSVSCAQA